jgi:ubiquinone/menaquinone biosynthesis C-methylase UbiE
MLKYIAREWIPQSISSRLWGDRKRWGLIVQPNDTCWKEWQRISAKAHMITQRNSIGTMLLNAGYGVMSDIDIAGKRILEIGPGDIQHIDFWRERPAEYFLADIHPEMLSIAEHKLQLAGIPSRSLLVNRGEQLPIEDSSVDIVISFNSLEHLYPLSPYLLDFSRVLRPGGILIGAIPTEGGLAWGLGRMLTTRRWFNKNTNVNLDKIICWEHPNFADQIVKELDRIFKRQSLTLWPIRMLPLLDANLVIRFLYCKGDNGCNEVIS